MKQSKLLDHIAMELFWCSMLDKENDSRAMDLIVSIHKMGPKAMFHFVIGMHCCMIQFKEYLQKEFPEIADEVIDDVCRRLKNG